VEFDASVGLIHKEFVTMHGHTILKFLFTYLRLDKYIIKIVHT